MNDLNKVRALVLLAIFTFGSLGSAHAATAVEPTVWWGPTEIGQGFHIRIPVTIVNNYEFLVTNAPALVQVDVAQALKQSGWVSVARGDRDILQSFRLDLATVRVVAMENLDSPTPGTRNGQLRVVEPSYPVGDLRRNEVPSLAMPGFLDKPQQQPFNSQTNPLLTVFWEVAGPLESGEKRFFMLYLDTPANNEHASANYRDKVAWGHLQSLFWSAPGLELVGVAAPGPQGFGTLTIEGLHPGTIVQSYSFVRGKWTPLVPPNGLPPNPVSIGAGQALQIYAGRDIANPVRIIANRPILGYGVGTGFVPSIDAGMVGNSFIFAKTRPSNPNGFNGIDDTIHFISTVAEPTTVTVQPIPPDGNVFTFSMGGGPNPNEYTVGARQGPYFSSNMPSPAQRCALISSTAPSPLLPFPQRYSAVVTQGGPVLLQHAPNYGVFQVPSDVGAPAGTSLHTATGMTFLALQTAGGGTPPATSCQPAPRIGNWFASGLDGPVEVRVTSKDSTTQVDPPGSATDPFPARFISAGPAVSEGYAALLFDRPLQFTSTGDMVLFEGMRPGLVPMLGNFFTFPIHGPWGGAEAGRRFVGQGATVLHAPYGDTKVTATMEVGGGTTVREIYLLAKENRLLEEVAGGPVGGFRLEATRPIIAYPLQVQPGTLAALPTFLPGELGAAEFRGRMVDVSSPTGLDPMTGSTTGDPITYTLQVTNLGRDKRGAGLQDSITLEVSAPHDGWTATLDRQSIPLAGGASADVHLTVTPTASVVPGSLGIFEVRAITSNPLVADSLHTISYLQRSYEVGLWFGDSDQGGDKVLTRSIEEGATTEYPLVVKNEGSVPDTIFLDATPPAEGWGATLLRDGLPVGQVSLDAKHVAYLTLRVTPPPGQADGVLTTIVTARGSNGALDHATATTKLRAPSDIGLEVGREQTFILPGQEALVPVTLTNKGRGAAEVALSLVSDGIRGWTPRGLFRVDAQGVRTNLTQITLQPGHSFAFTVGTRAPAYALAGQSVGMQVVARTLDGRDRTDAYAKAVVRPLHRLNFTLPALPLASESGFDGATVPLRLTNQGNLHERLSLRTRDIPLGWSLGTPGGLFVPRNATQSFSFNLTVPAKQAAGTYNLTLDFISQDGNQTALHLPVAIGNVARSTTGLVGGAQPVQPGQPASVTVPIRNEGNIPLEVRVLSTAADAWPLLDTDRSFLLPPGDNASVQVAWEVPIGAPDGVSRHAAQIVLATSSGERTVRDVQATFDIGRADLAPAGFRAYPGPAGTLLEGHITNTGNRAAPPFVVRLLADQQAVEDLGVESLAAGANATVRLLLPRGHAGPPSIIVDATAAVVEADEMNNAVSLGPQNRIAPSAGIAAILTLLAVALAKKPKVRRQ